MVLARRRGGAGAGAVAHRRRARREAVRSLDAPTLALGAALAVPTTVACAWRWRLVARGLGAELPLGTAVAAYYRSQLLNSSLPAGVVGDVVRGVQHGRAGGDTARGLRSVAWERTAGQVVQMAVAVVVLTLLPSPLRPSAPALVLLGAAAVAAVVAITAARRRASIRGRHPGQAASTLRDDLRGLRAQRCWPGVVIASAVALAGHTATYVLAARAVGVTAPVATLAPLVLLVLVAAGLPTNLAGWGPREGMAAWAFGVAGLGAAQGVASAVAYGAIVLVACLPGAGLLLVGAARPHAGRPAGAPLVAGRAHG